MLHYVIRLGTLEVFNILISLLLTLIFFFPAVLEWILGFGLALYLLTFYRDLSIPSEARHGRERIIEAGPADPEVGQ